MTQLRSRFLEWDTQFFGVRIASLQGEDLTDAVMQRELVSWREQAIECVYLSSNISDTPTHRVAQKYGFQLVDLRVTLEARLDRTPPPARETPRVRDATPADVAALRAIASSGHRDTRFYNDGRFDRERCDELYATWIEKSCAGWAERVLVAESEGRPVGYLSCHLRDGGRGEIGLVCVAPDASRQGLGNDLVVAALSWFESQARRQIAIVTQGRNLPAQRLYQSLGFQTIGLEYWHHLWLSAKASP